MGIRKCAALAVSSLILGGAAALTVGAATPASAGDSHRSGQAIRIYNKNFNFSRSDSEQAQRNRQRNFQFDRDFRFDREGER